ncbi:hypothetical protein ACE1CI_18075 [Aerosakkonemataceae cyanobacterium BLCC-F50]|uniref:Uncharacterized protein n=1 Tax=Floridaenema flaviceps BLCC-F50 TaxID=3153642 RepID=A0ABV4XTQ5_9CYAN
MDNFLTRLVKRTLGLIPVVQPMITSMFVPGEIALDSFSSGLDIENNMTEPFWSGETMSTFPPDLPVQSSSNLSEEISTSSVNKTSSSTFKQLVESHRNKLIVDSSLLEISKLEQERSTATQIARQGNYTHNQSELNTIPHQKTVEVGTQFSLLSQAILSSSVPDLRSSSRDIEEERQSAKTNKSDADLFEVVVQNINKNPSSFFQNPNIIIHNEQPNTLNTIPTTVAKEATPSQDTFESSLERVEPLVKQQRETGQKIESQSFNIQTAESQLITNPTTINTNNVFLKTNPLTRIKLLVDRVFQTQQRRHDNLTLPTHAVKITEILLPSNLNLKTILRNRDSKVHSVQPIETEKISVYRNIEKTIPIIDKLKINDLSKKVESIDIPNPQITALTPNSEVVKTIQPSEKFKLSQAEYLNNNEAISAIESTRHIILPQQSTNRVNPSSELIDHKQISQTPFLSNSQLEQPVVLRAKQLNFIQLNEDATLEQQENSGLGNKDKSKNQPYTNKNIVNQISSQPTPTLIILNPKVDGELQPELQRSYYLSIAGKERLYDREFAYLSRRSLSVLSQSSSEQLSVAPIVNTLPEYRQLNSINQREVANAEQTVGQHISNTETTIQITIGRVELRANNPPASSTPRNKLIQREPKLSLQDYLKQRQGKSDE